MCIYIYIYIYIDDSLAVSLETWVVIVELEYMRHDTGYDMHYIIYMDDMISKLVYTYILWRLRRSWVSYYVLRGVIRLRIWSGIFLFILAVGRVYGVDVRLVLIPFHFTIRCILIETLIYNPRHH